MSLSHRDVFEIVGNFQILFSATTISNSEDMMEVLSELTSFSPKLARYRYSVEQGVLDDIYAWFQDAESLSKNM